MTIQNLRTLLLGHVITNPTTGDIGKLTDIQWMLYKDSIELRFEILNSNAYWIENYSQISLYVDDGKSFLSYLSKRSAEGILKSKLYRLIA